MYIHLYYLRSCVLKGQLLKCSFSLFSRNIKLSFTFTRGIFEESFIAKMSIQ